MINKNIKVIYYIKAIINLHLPVTLLKWHYKRICHNLNKTDLESFNNRLSYYNQLSTNQAFESSELTYTYQTSLKNHIKVYFLDFMIYYKIFPKTSKAILLEGDIITIPDNPSFVKSRPIQGNNTNSVLLKFDKVRHFNFIKDPFSYEDKKDTAIFRGRNIAKSKDCRRILLEKFIHHPHINVGLGTQNPQLPKEWLVPYTPIKEQLKYKFILCPEGNDVATNLKWVMSSNSVAIMPKPVYETWFMEGRLKDGIHYIEVKDDYSDLEEKIAYYTAHPDKAKEIINNAHKHINRFNNKHIETALSLAVINKYLEYTDQKQNTINLHLGKK